MEDAAICKGLICILVLEIWNLNRTKQGTWAVTLLGLFFFFFQIETINQHGHQSKCPLFSQCPPRSLQWQAPTLCLKELGVQKGLSSCHFCLSTDFFVAFGSIFELQHMNATCQAPARAHQPQEVGLNFLTKFQGQISDDLIGQWWTEADINSRKTCWLHFSSTCSHALTLSQVAWRSLRWNLEVIFDRKWSW